MAAYISQISTIFIKPHKILLVLGTFSGIEKGEVFIGADSRRGSLLGCLWANLSGMLGVDGGNKWVKVIKISLGCDNI